METAWRCDRWQFEIILRRPPWARAHPDFAIFAALPAAGAACAPRLLAAFGTPRDRYRNAAEVQQFTGIAPVTETSGNQHWVHWRWSCPKFLRQTFQEWAAQTIQQCDWAAAYYRVQRDDKKKSHHAAVRSLAYKWIRIIFRCWKGRERYDESRYEGALKRQHQKAAAKSVQPSPFELAVQECFWQVPFGLSLTFDATISKQFM